MSRIRLNNLTSGITLTNPITLSSATTNTCTWSTSPAFPQIASPDYAVVIVEPDSPNEEVVHLIGFSPGGTVGLVVRAAESNAIGLTAAIIHTAVAWAHGPTAMDFSPTRSAAVMAQMAFV